VSPATKLVKGDSRCMSINWSGYGYGPDPADYGNFGITLVCCCWLPGCY